jgi:hypothetical protein
VHEEHVEDRKLNNGLIRAGTDSVQGAREVPLSGSVKYGLPHHRSENEECRDQEHGSATDLHRDGNPKTICESLGEARC